MYILHIIFYIILHIILYYIVIMLLSTQSKEKTDIPENVDFETELFSFFIYLCVVWWVILK